MKRFWSPFLENPSSKGLGTVCASALPTATGRLRAPDCPQAVDLAPLFSQPMRVALRVCEKMPARGAGIQGCCYSKYFRNNQKHLSFFVTDEEINSSAAFRRSFLCRRAHVAAQKRRSEIKRAFRKKAPVAIGNALAEPVRTTPERWIFKEEGQWVAFLFLSIFCFCWRPLKYWACEAQYFLI